MGLGPCERARPEVAEYVLGKGIVRKGGGLPPLSANFFPLVFRKNSIIGKIGPIVSVRLAAFSQFFFTPLLTSATLLLVSQQFDIVCTLSHYSDGNTNRGANAKLSVT